MHMQLNLLHRIVRLSRLWIWVIIFFCLFLSAFISKAEEHISDNNCSNSQNTIPSYPPTITLREGTSATFQHALCGELQKPLTVTFTLSPTTALSNTLTLAPTELHFSSTMTNPQTVTIHAIDSPIYTPTQKVIIYPQIKTYDAQFKNVEMMTITVIIADKEKRVHLPITSKAPPTPTPVPPQWQRVGGAGQDSDVIALHQNYLFLGDRREKNAGGGIYRTATPLNGCPQTIMPFEGPRIVAKILDLAFYQNSDARGLGGTFGDKVLYSSDHGSSWRATNTSTNPFVYAVAFTDNAQKSYAGADDGVYLSSNSGVTWVRMGNSPTAINTFYRNGNLLWIGTFQKGVWTLTIDNDTFADKSSNLAGKAKEVWDIVYSAVTNTYYLATSDGVYRGSGNGNWEKIGLSNLIVYSLAVTNDQIYAGLNSGGVQRRPLNLASDWVPLTQGTGWKTDFTVRDLLYDGNLCNGVFAATNDGVWIYR